MPLCAGVTWQRAVDLWRSPSAEGASFREITVHALQDVAVDMVAFFWETPPFSADTSAHVPFEFVALEAPGLEHTQEDGSAFAEHPNPPPPAANGSSQLANRSQQFRIFENLGRDALLVAPPVLSNRSMIPRGAFGHIAGLFLPVPKP